MNPPDKIYLQWHGSGEPDDIGPINIGEVTHSINEPVFKHDIEYVRALPDPKQWLKAETEADHGPMETWPEEVKDKFYRDLGFLHHFVTSNQKEVMPVTRTKPIDLTSPANVLSGCGATIRKVLGDLMNKEVDAKKIRLRQSEVWRTMKPTKKFPKQACIENSKREKRIADKIDCRINELWIAFDEFEQLIQNKS